MPSSYPAGRFSLIALRTALSAARRSAGSAARYWATVEAVMLATIPAAVRGRELYGGSCELRSSLGKPATRFGRPRLCGGQVSGSKGVEYLLTHTPEIV